MDTAAIIIAIVGLFVSALSFGWQIATWALSGRRVKVRLIHGVEGRGGFAAGPVKRGGAPNDIRSMRSQGWSGREVLGIEVVNIGRANVTIKKYSVHPAGGGMSYTPHGDAIGPSLPFRLEPGESETWYSDMQDARALLKSLKVIGRSATRVRMGVNLGTGDERKTRRTLRVV